MSRIRSVHPGLWTDERFMEVSPLARLLQIGIWNECDDQGSFAWSPITLKARLLPVDNCDIHALLTELCTAGSVMSYEIDGKRYGAVRNFARYQRPKKPNSLYPQTNEVRNYCAGKPTSVPNRFPTDGENAPQREEGGDNREEEEENADAFVKVPVEEFDLDIDQDPPAPPALLPEHVVEAWNAMAQRHGLAKVVKLTDARRKALKTRIAAHPIADFLAAIAAIERSQFLLGGGRDGWRADFDFLLQPSSFVKLIEGSYDRGNH